MNVLLTGATGFLGTIITNRLAEKGYEIYALIRNETKAKDWLDTLSLNTKKAVHFVYGDLLKPSGGLTDKRINELTGKIDSVIHSAAYLSFDDNERETVFQINRQGTRELLKLAEKLDISTFLHVSTAYTLGRGKEGFEALYQPENREFVNAYEESKCYAEHDVMSYQEKFHVAVLRPAIIVGNSETGDADSTFGLYGVMRAVELMKRHVQKQRNSKLDSFKIVVSDEEKTHLVPVDYVAEIVTGALTKSVNGSVYNVTNPYPPTNGMIMSAIRDGFDFQELEWVSFDQTEQLTKLEQKMNEPLAVFEPYLNRTIDFSEKNTRALLDRLQLNSLAMDRAMLDRIVAGFRHRNEQPEHV
ncbi:SDR family NAD(P)-dependent oxidoreductase [Salisediminibacterium halotolerans]|uniref:Nucleoside-diphosphate-sugar epimerase n=1 Tax=Salisediminibacterium halotolerans TaxID=517425 RepID=A0A1H9WAU5_9BACI|nr:SDR family NAD(P)-dependent oxidoreductase [Salisediminibacterium haloalkalitolerans]SES31030.1 Nucleoside-diphosphate-sugar epimerase [Salisediminibacterium haloalkalitolerans]